MVSFLLIDWTALAALIPAPDGSGIPEITPAIRILSLIQPTVILIVAVLIGLVLSPRVGLSAPVAESLASGRVSLAPLKPQLVPGLIGGLVGAVSIVLTAVIAKPFLMPGGGNNCAPALSCCAGGREWCWDVLLDSASHE